jgi:demethylmenaquinone methyltransferase/2-methoxy-6-polyprenyl-1,4-benzoquinol methylase
MEIDDREIGAYFDECARNCFMESFSPEEEAKLDILFNLWNITPGKHVLEPGCGTGRLTERIAAKVGPGGYIYACDLSVEMIRRARERRLPGCVQFAQGSAESIRSKAAAFDASICLNVFPHFSNPARTLAEICRVLKSGGHLWINHFKNRDQVNDTHRNAASVIISHMIPEEEEIRRLITAAGFSVCELLNTSDTGYRLHAVKN